MEAIEDLNELVSHVEGWVNLGDANPEDHGGRFITHTGGGEMRLIETQPWEDIAPADYPEEGHLFTEHYIYVNDYLLTEEGEPTDVFESVVEAHNMPSIESALVNYDIEYWAVDVPFHAGMLGDEKTVPLDEYWDTLEEMGVPVEQFR